MEGSRRPLLSLGTRQDGFTIIEVLVAAVILLIGIMGVLGVVVQDDTVSASNRAREQGVGLEREIVEAARSIPYDQLTQTSIVSRIRAQAGLNDSTMTSKGWTYTRRNIDFTVAVGTCAVDDPGDGTGPHETAGYCINGTGTTSATQCLAYLGRSGSIAGNGTASGAAAADCGIDSNFDGAVDGLTDTSGSACTNCSGSDTNPNDYKRIIVLVRWNRGLGTRYALQSTTVPNPGLAAAPAISSLTTNPVKTTIGPNDSRYVNFTLTTSQTPATVAWYVDGTAKGQATGSGTNWNFTWDLGNVSSTSTPNTGEILDGTYQVSAKAFDVYGQGGTAKVWTLNLNRRAPYPPSVPHAGLNDGNAYLDWGVNAERDVEGYRVYRQTAGGPQLVCNYVQRVTRCQENGIPSGAQQYYVVAVDRDSNGNLRNGDASTLATIPAGDNPPNGPTYLTAAKLANGDTKLSWIAPSVADIDAGDSIIFYRIYRDGTDWVNDLYDQTSSGSTTTYTDTQTNGDVHQYSVVAVDQSYSESRPLMQVSK